MQIFVSAIIAPPPRRRLAPARAVAARHRHRAAGDWRGARPRLLVLFVRIGALSPQARRSLPAAARGRVCDRLDHFPEGLEAVTADERVAMLERGDHSARL